MEQVNEIKKLGRQANAKSVRQRIIALALNEKLVLTPSDITLGSARAAVSLIGFDYNRRFSVITNRQERTITISRVE
jgi:hypothetical protein